MNISVGAASRGEAFWNVWQPDTIRAADPVHDRRRTRLLRGSVADPVHNRRDDAAPTGTI